MNKFNKTGDQFNVGTNGEKHENVTIQKDASDVDTAVLD